MSRHKIFIRYILYCRKYKRSAFLIVICILYLVTYYIFQSLVLNYQNNIATTDQDYDDIGMSHKQIKIANSSYFSKCQCRTEKIVLTKHSSDTYQVSSSLSTFRNYEVTTNEISRIKCGHFNTLRRGKKQKVISTTLYGRNKKYYNLLKG